MAYICDICGSSLSSKTTLKTHKETTKRCLLLRKQIPNTKTVEENKDEQEVQDVLPEKKHADRLDCQLCDLNVLRYKYKNHLKACKKYDPEKFVYQKHVVFERIGDKLIPYRKRIEISMDEYNEMKEKISKHEEKIVIEETALLRQKDLEIAFLKEELKQSKDELKRYMNTLEKKAFEPRTVNNQTSYYKPKTIIEKYITKKLPHNTEKYKEAVENKLKIKHIKEGEIGLANFYLDEVVRDKETDKVDMICCNKREKVLQYMDEKDNLISDPGGALLLSNLNTNLVPLIDKKVQDFGENIQDKKEQKDFKYIYGSKNTLGATFSEHVANRVFVNKLGAESALRPSYGKQNIKTASGARLQSKKTKDVTKRKKEVVRQEKEDEERSG